MENKFFINADEYLKNINDFELATKTGIDLGTIKGFKVNLEYKPTSGSAVYATWSDIWLWMKFKYPNFNFLIKSIENGNVTGQLWINETMQHETTLSVENFKSGESQKVEQITMRVFVKLVAITTGFGIELWNAPTKFKQPKNNKFYKGEF